MLGTPKEHLATEEVAARLTSDQWQVMESVYQDVTDTLSPGDEERTTGRLMALLAHYFITPLPAQLHSAVFNDWLTILAPYPNWAIENACTYWLKTKSKKPHPRDILALTREEIKPLERLGKALDLLFRNRDQVTD